MKNIVFGCIMNKKVSTYQQLYKSKIFLIGLIETISSLDPYNVLTGVLSHINV